MMNNPAISGNAKSVSPASYMQAYHLGKFNKPWYNEKQKFHSGSKVYANISHDLRILALKS